MINRLLRQIDKQLKWPTGVYAIIGAIGFFVALPILINFFTKLKAWAFIGYLLTIFLAWIFLTLGLIGTEYNKKKKHELE